MKLVKLEDVNFKILKNFSIDFRKDNKILNLIVLAGVNGSGKTTLLDFINYKFDNPYKIEGKIYFEYKGELYFLQKDGYLYRTTKVSNSIGKFFAYLRGEIYLSKRDTLMKVLHYIKAKDDKSKDLKISIIRHLKKLIFEDGLAPNDAYKKLDEYLKTVFKGMKLSISFSNIDKDENVYFKNMFGEKVKIEDLSTGEKEILNKAFYFFINDIKDSVILIDEPEISLHPSWQSYILKVYQNLAKEFNNQVIIATHSPHIIASTPDESLFILTKEDGKIVAKNFNSYGKDINAVLLEVMRTEYLRDIDVEEQIKKVKNMIFENKFNTREFEEEFRKLEKMLENDNIELSLIKLELQRRKNVKNN